MKASEEFARLLRELIAATPPRPAPAGTGPVRAEVPRGATWREWLSDVQDRRNGSLPGATIDGSSSRIVRPRPHPLHRPSAQTAPPGLPVGQDVSRSASAGRVGAARTSPSTVAEAAPPVLAETPAEWIILEAVSDPAPRSADTAQDSAGPRGAGPEIPSPSSMQAAGSTIEAQQGSRDATVAAGEVQASSGTDWIRDGAEITATEVIAWDDVWSGHSWFVQSPDDDAGAGALPAANSIAADGSDGPMPERDEVAPDADAFDADALEEDANDGDTRDGTREALAWGLANLVGALTGGPTPVWCARRQREDAMKRIAAPRPTAVAVTNAGTGDGSPTQAHAQEWASPPPKTDEAAAGTAALPGGGAVIHARGRHVRPTRSVLFLAPELGRDAGDAPAAFPDDPCTIPSPPVADASEARVEVVHEVLQALAPQAGAVRPAPGGGRSAAATPPPATAGGEARGSGERPRDALLRLRRTWLGPSFKRAPHTVMVVSVRVAGGAGADTPATALLLASTHAAVGKALAEFGEVHTTGDFTRAILLPGRALAQAERIAESLREAVEALVSEHPGAPVLFAAGLAALHRDEEPTAALCVAEHCLWLAEQSPDSGIVTSSDPRARQGRRR